MVREYWAKVGKIQVGPHPSKDEALAAFRAAYPFTKPSSLILTGYGKGGPLFSLQWERFAAR